VSVKPGAGQVVSVEVLARWTHKTKGSIPPSEFIPVAEEAGLIVELGNWIMLKARHDAMWMKKDIKVAVNLSPVQFSNSNVVAAAMFATAESGLDAKRLELEITEGVLLEENEQNLATLRRLKDLGVSIQLTTSLNRSTVAEGIDSQDQLDRVRSLGLKFGQGYLFSKPVRAS
jgi:EAL domain-containing protein (putative c-di-GMP-specific phosphodiesterase class I)